MPTNTAPLSPLGMTGPQTGGLQGPVTATGMPMQTPQLAPNKSIWDSFTDTLINKNIAPLGNAIGGAIMGHPSPTVDTNSEIALNQKVRDALAAVDTNVLPAQTNTPKNPLSKGITKAEKISTDVLLFLANKANDIVIKPLITTPLATGAILTDPNSALYKDKKNGIGFQLGDLDKAVTQGKRVSPMQAIASNSIFQNTPPGILTQGLSDVFHGPDFSKVNIMSDKSIKDNYVNNTFGKIFTGVGDVAISIPTFSVLGKAVTGISDIFRASAGMAAKNAPLQDVLTNFEKNANAGILHDTSGGTEGYATVAGKQIAEMAQETSPSKLQPLFSNYSNNRLLLPFVARETNPNKILDMILADNGVASAAERLFNDNPLSSYVAMGGHDAVASEKFLSNGAWLPEGETLNRLHNVHIDSIKLTPEHENFWNAFHDPKTDEVQLFGTGHVPAEGPIALAVDNGVGWIERQVGGHNNATTRLVSLVGSRMPNWYISFKNTTPWQALTELDASFNSLKMFRNPDNIITTDLNKTMKASDYIRETKDKYLQATTDEERYGVLNKLKDEIGIVLARTKGVYVKGETEKIISDLQGRVSRSHKSLADNGFGFDASGTSVEVNAKTQSQLSSSIRLFPWDRVENELDYHQANMFGKIGEKQSLIPGEVKFGYTPGKFQLKSDIFMQDVFRKMGEWLSVDMIGKPSYIWKQSLLEPMIGALIAMGPRFLTENLPHGISNFLKNNLDRVNESVIRVGQYLPGERSKIVNKVAELGNELNVLMENHTKLENEFSAFYVQKTKTMKTVDEYGPEVVKAYKDSLRAVKAAEEEYRMATRQFVDIPDVPSPAHIQNRINFLKENGFATHKGNTTLISNAEFALRKAKESASMLAEPGAVRAADEAIATSYDKLNEVFSQFSDAQKKQYEIFSKKKVDRTRRSSEGNPYRMVGTGDNAKWMRMPDVFDENAVGDALKADVSNVQTSKMTYANDFTIGTRANIMRRHVPTTVTDVTDPHYYSELATLMNTYYRQDILVQKILSGRTLQELQSWGNSRLGVRYMKGFNVFDAQDVSTQITDLYARVHRYLPDEKTRQLVLKRVVSPFDLQKGLHPFISQLVPIHPRDFNYGEINSGLGTSAPEAISNAIDRGTSAIFTTIMRPENPLRYAFTQDLAKDISARKATLLADQGIEPTFQRLEALKEASFIEASAETRKIFYTVTNANRTIYASRLVTMFPTATFNAFYRYSRMAVKYPVNTLGFLKAYNSFYTTFGIDDNGNPVSDNRKAKYLALPLTKDLGMFKGQGMRIPTSSVGFILNSPSLSPYASVPVSIVVQRQPSADDSLKTFLGSNYDVIFPYGTTKTDFLTVAMPGWARDMFSWLRSPMAKGVYLNAVQSLYDYHQVLVSMKIEKSMPSLQQVQKEANHLYNQKAWYEFIAPTPVKMDTNPMNIYQQLYYKISNQNKSITNQDEALKKTNMEYLSIVGSKFPIDQITFTGSSANANIAKTQEGYARVFHDNVDLTKQLVHLDPKDPFVVTLLTADINVTDANRSAVVAQKLNQPDMTLPDIGGVVALNGMKLNPEQVQEQRLNQRTWDKFFQMKSDLDIIAQGSNNRRGVPYKNMDSVPVLREALKTYAENILGKENPTWLVQDYNTKKNMQKDFVYAQGMNLIVNNKKFMDQNGSKPFWKDVKAFTELRNFFTGIYNDVPSGPQKTAYLNAYNANLFGDPTTNPPIEGRIGTYDPKLQRIITMYFRKDSLEKVVGNGN